MWPWRKDLRLEGREGEVVAGSLAQLCAVSPLLLRCSTKQHDATQHHTTPHYAMPHHTTQDGGTSSLVSPPGLATILLPDFSTSAIALLLAFLTTGPVMIPVGLMEELGQLAAVLELKIDYTAALAGSRSGDLVRVWRSGAGASWWSSNPGTQDLLREKRKREVEELTTWVQGRVELMKYVRIPSQVRRSSTPAGPPATCPQV